MLDAAAVLQVRRSQLAAALAAGRDVDAVVVDTYVRGQTQAVLRQSDTWSGAPVGASVRHRCPAPREPADHAVAGGRRTAWMTSIYDADGSSPEARTLLACESLGTYLLSVAPVQLKIIDRTHVLPQGPLLDDHATVMAVRSRTCVDAAWRYWEAVRQIAFPVRESVALVGDLTDRQRQVAALMSTGIGDDAIAVALGVSVRTVRSDVAGCWRRSGCSRGSPPVSASSPGPTTPPDTPDAAASCNARDRPRRLVFPLPAAEPVGLGSRPACRASGGRHAARSPSDRVA